MQLTVSTAGVIENRVQPDAPGASWPDTRDWFVQWQMALREERGDVVVNSSTALTYSVVWRCVNYIASTIASLCWHVYEESDGGRVKLPVHDNIAWTLEMQANPEMSAFDWRQVMLRDVLLTGNAFAEVERNGAGKPLWLWRIDPGRVYVQRDDAGRLVYVVSGPQGGTDAVLDPMNVFHLKGFSPDGLVGYSPIAVARRAIELGLQQEQYGVGFFRRGPTPGGFLKAPGAMKEEERRAMGQSFNAGYGGARNAGRVAVLSGGVEFVPFNMPNADAQFIESRGLQAEEICRVYGVPQHIAGILTHSTNNNIEHQGIEAVQYCLYPWCRRLETAADLVLFGRVNQGRRRTKLDLRTLLRGDSVTQANRLSTLTTTGLMQINEGREELDLNPIDGGDSPLIQGAMVPLTSITGGGDSPTEPGGLELLDVPQLLQEYAYDCGACCARIVAEFFGVGGGRGEADYIKELGTTTKDGTPPEAIVDVLNDLGLVTTSGGGMTLDGLRCAFADGKPVIVPIQSLDAGTTGNAEGHWVVVIGVALGQVFLQDPVAGRVLLSEDDFETRWHDLEADGVMSDHFGIVVSDGFDEPEEEAEPEAAPAAAPAKPTPAPAPKPAAILRRLRNFDRDEERDEHGRWTKGGGGEEKAAKEKAGGKEKQRAAEDKKTASQRAKEDKGIKTARRKEDAAVQKGRDQEDKAHAAQKKGREQEARKEDAAIAKQHRAEDTATAKQRAKEDKTTERQRAKEDKKAGERTPEQQAAVSKSRQEEDRSRQQDRDRQDAATRKERDDQKSERNEGRRRAESFAEKVRQGRSEERLKQDAQKYQQRKEEDATRQEKRDKEDARKAKDRRREDKQAKQSKGKVAKNAAGARLLAGLLNEFDESKVERDDSGRFSTGGGSSEDDSSEEDARQAARDAEDEAHQERATQEESDLEASHDAENAAVEAAREKEDAEAEAAQEKLEAQRGKEREKEDAAVEKAAEKLEAAREKEDDRTSSQRDKEDEKRQAQRDKADEKQSDARDREDAKIDAAREKEDDERTGRQEAEYSAANDKYTEAEEGSPEEAKALAERDAVSAKHDAENDAVEAARSREDEQRQAARDAEDAADVAAREKEDRDVEAAREKEDNDREQARAAEDAAIEQAATEREAKREREDAEHDQARAARDERREREDKQREARQQAEREALSGRHESEERARQAKRDAEDAAREQSRQPANRAALSAAFAPLLADVYSRLLRVESDKATRAAKRGDLGRWTAGYFADGSGVEAAVKPVVEALAAAGAGVGGGAAARLAADHVAVSRAWAEAGKTEQQPGRAQEQAARHLAMILEDHR